ncbi:hypothetical protein SAMN05443270_3141 [Lacrimispora sphenoides]|nr:hypothetical protein SAMN05443270_3141 [Lacrimispora sphenoides]
MEVIYIKTFLKGLLATAIGILLTTLEFVLVISFIAAIVAAIIFLVSLLPSIIIGLRLIGIIILLLILLLWIAANSVDAYRNLKMRVEND